MSMARTNEHKREYLRRLISASPVYMVNEYKYFVYPFKGLTPIRNVSLNYLTELLCRMLQADHEEFRTITTVMTDGVISALPVAMRLKKDLLIARDFHYNYPDAVPMQQKTGYRSRLLYIARANEIGEPVVFIDAVVSTGMTALTVVDAFRELGIAISHVYTVVNKVEHEGEVRLREAGITLHALFDVRIEGNQIICVNHGENVNGIKRARQAL